MTVSYDPTPEQESAIIKLRKHHNRKNGTDLTNKQYAEMRCPELFASLIMESAVIVDREGLIEDYKTATPAVRAQIDTLLGR